MRKLILISIFISIVFHSFSQTNLYWVNGAGSWHDQAHWSEMSGGDPGTFIPNENTNVFIDENSSILSGDDISIKEEVKVNDLSITAPVTLKGSKTLEINGSIKVSDKAILKKFKGDIVLTSLQNSKLICRSN